MPQIEGPSAIDPDSSVGLSRYRKTEPTAEGNVFDKPLRQRMMSGLMGPNLRRISDTGGNIFFLNPKQ